MFAIVQAIGWPVWPLIAASVLALALLIERSVSLRHGRVFPAGLLDDVLGLVAAGRVDGEVITKLETNSPLGTVLASALRHAGGPRDRAQRAVELTGGYVAHDLARNLTLLGAVGSIAPLLGLLGTVVGMIEIFGSQQAGADPQQLAQGISVALYSTAFGIIVAVPSVLGYRIFRSRVDDFLVEMERQSERLFAALFPGGTAERAAA